MFIKEYVSLESIINSIYYLYKKVTYLCSKLFILQTLHTD